MEMKNILVTFTCPEAVRETLKEAVRGMATVTFREESWTRETYLEALGEAHIIIGEPRNEDFEYCRNLQLMHSPSSGVNYSVDGGKFPQDAIFCCMTGGYGNVLAEHLLALVLSLCRRLPSYRDSQRAHIWEDEGAMKTMLGINPTVHLVAPKSIVRSEGKAVRIIDKRKLHD